MNDIIEFLDDLKSKPKDHRIIAWRTFCKDIQRLTPMQREILRDELIRRHEDASEELAEEYEDAKSWFRKGASRQDVLDKHLYNQLELLTLSFV